VNKILGEEVEYPEYNAAAMGAGVEDMPYMSKYDACRYGWDCALVKMAENGTLYIAPPRVVVDEAMVQRAALAMFSPPISNNRMDDVRAGLKAVLEQTK